MYRIERAHVAVATSDMSQAIQNPMVWSVPFSLVLDDTAEFDLMSLSFFQGTDNEQSGSTLSRPSTSRISHSMKPHILRNLFPFRRNPSSLRSRLPYRSFPRLHKTLRIWNTTEARRWSHKAESVDEIDAVWGQGTKDGLRRHGGGWMCWKA